MDFSLVASYGSRDKIQKIVQAVEIGDLAALYGSVRGANEALVADFFRFLLVNPIKGYMKAIDILRETPDALTAIRAAAVCLLIHRFEGQELE